MGSLLFLYAVINNIQVCTVEMRKQQWVPFSFLYETINNIQVFTVEMRKQQWVKFYFCMKLSTI